MNMATIAVVEAQGAHDAPQVQEGERMPGAGCLGLNSFRSEVKVTLEGVFRRINQWTTNS